MEFPLPAGLTRLLALGVWPLGGNLSMSAQVSHRLMPADRVRRFAADESLICLQPPPFPTIAQERAGHGASDFWERFGALDQIVPEKAAHHRRLRARFRLRRSSWITLATHRTPPCCICAGGRTGGPNGCRAARDFDEFAEILGLARPG